MLQARACGTVYRRTCDETWTLRVSSVNWKHSIRELVNHGALWLFAVLRLRNTLTYLLTYLLSVMAISAVKLQCGHTHTRRTGRYARQTYYVRCGQQRCVEIRPLEWRLPPPGAGLPLSFLNWAYVHQGVYFWAYGTPGVSTFGVFRTPSLPIFGVIFGLLEATKIYKLF